MVNTDGWAWMGGDVFVTVTPTWQRLCRSDIQVAAPTFAYFSVLLGATAAAYQLDDLQLVWSVCCASPTPAPAPSPSPKPPAVPSLPSPSPLTSPYPPFAMEYTSSFESAAKNASVDGFFVFSGTGAFDQASTSVSVALNSPGAARTGAYGFRVTVRTAPPSDYQMSGVAQFKVGRHAGQLLRHPPCAAYPIQGWDRWEHTPASHAV